MKAEDWFKPLYLEREFLKEVLIGTLFGIPLKAVCVLREGFIFLVRYKTKRGRKSGRGNTVTLKKDLK